MIDHSGIRKGARFIIDGQPYEVLESMPLKKAQRRVVIQSKIKNLLNGSTCDRNFHQGDVFEEAELTKIDVKFLYTHKDKYFFCKAEDPSARFEFTKEQLGETANYLKPNEIAEGVVFDERIINISLPIKVQLKVIQAASGFKGDTAQGGTKPVTLETGKDINVPLFIEEGDIIEINTENNQYVRRVEKK